tara:strand:+ start:77 stop:484 length:408 start_codon:yes stop_codon:yes gene_type:complete
MKSILFSLLILFTVNVSAISWKKVGQNKEGSSFYFDVESIKQSNGSIYYLSLVTYIELTKIGTHSNISEYKVDCFSEKQTWLSNTFYSQPMATGKIITEAVPVWNHYGSTLNEIRNLTTGSIEHQILKEVCDYLK